MLISDSGAAWNAARASNGAVGSYCIEMHCDGTAIASLYAMLPRRVGSTLGNALIACSLLGTFLVAAVIVTPMTLQAAGDDLPLPVQARDDANQQVIEHLVSLIARSDEIIATHKRGETPYTELVLRMHREGDRTISEGEIAVLSHSEILQTVTLYTLSDDSAPDDDRQRVFRNPSTELSQQRHRLRDPKFCNLWRSDPSVSPRIIAAGVTGMNIDIVERIDSDHVRVRLELTWGSDSTDDEDIASVIFHAAMQK